jgi:hypothetical protein
MLVEKEGKTILPLINDFMMKTVFDNDTTEAILSQPGRILFIIYMEGGAQREKIYLLKTACRY